MAPNIITLIGSSKFMDYFSTMMWEIEKRGVIALGLHWVVAVPERELDEVPDHLAEHEGVADILDNLHLRKIDLADEVLLLAIGGYVGESTSKEIKYAASIGTSLMRIENWEQCLEWLLMLDKILEEEEVTNAEAT